MAVIGEAVLDAAEAVTGTRPGPVARMTWHQAQDRYGSDKPDVRFGLELVDLCEVFAATEFRAFQAPMVKGIRLPGQGTMSRAQVDKLIERAKRLGAGGLVWMRVGARRARLTGGEVPERERTTRLVRRAGRRSRRSLTGGRGGAACRGSRAGDAAGGDRPAARARGWTALSLGRRLSVVRGLDDDGRPIPAHHPFTMPHPDDMEILEHGTGEDLLGVRSLAYDLVLNGWELGSGSVRIHRPDIQQRIFSLLGISPDDAQARFGFLLDAFRYGAPPHAGFAFGIDRLAAVLAGEDNIREVIAFPKTQSGADPLTGAPAPIDPTQLPELGLTVTPRPKP